MIFVGPERMLLESAEDVVFGQILVFANIFDFPGLKKARFKHCVYIMREYVSRKFWQNQALFGGERAPNPPKWGISWMLNSYENFITCQPQMLHL